MNWLLTVGVVMLVGCAQQSGPDPVTVTPVSTPLMISEGSLLPGLNVTVARFTVDTSESVSSYSALAQVRSVEQRLLPFQLKRTLERSGHWGAVRVMPADDPNAELLISGKILDSTGVELRLHIKVTDKTGRVWIDDAYEDAAALDDYRKDPSPEIDPFQDLNNRIANDMVKVLNQMSLSDIDELLTVGLLHYAAALSPESFENYLHHDGVRTTITALPAEDDPLMLRVLRLRDSEAVFADSVDEHYESLFRRVGQTYAWWRHYSFELIDGNRRLENADVRRGATKGTWYAMERVYKTYKESKMNEDALRELTMSFDRETAPINAEISGRVLRLSGTLEEQTAEWRRLLRELYREETGF